MRTAYLPIAIVFLAVGAAGLSTDNTGMLPLAVLGLVFLVLAFTQKSGDGEDVADDGGDADATDGEPGTVNEPRM